MSRLLKTMHRFRQLRPLDIQDIARAYFYLLLAGWHLFVTRGKGTRWIRYGLEVAPDVVGPADELRGRRAARWVNGAAFFPVQWARCLQRSVALCMWMERRGLSPTLRLGVRKNGTGIDAHSWVEMNGQVVNDDAAVRDVFTQFTAARHGRAITPPRNEQPDIRH